MWGPGAIIHIINILPFASMFLLNFAFRRGNFLGINPMGNSRTYYKRWWTRMFFGRWNYTLFTVLGSLSLAYNYQKIKVERDQYLSFSVDYLHALERYDEEEHPQAHRTLIAHMYAKRLENARDLALKERAKRNYDEMLAAFEELSSELDKN
jgi:hypothetical protein